MINVVAGTLEERQFVQRFADPMYELRYRVFFERLGWHVSVRNGKEADEFDDTNSTYLITTGPLGVVSGGWRLRSTMYPYMLSQVFPELLHGAKPPVDRSIWEISRFAVHRDRNHAPSYGFGGAARALVRETVRFAERNNISRYVMVVSIGLERLLRALGLKLHRFGPPKRIGRVMSVAIWLDVDWHTRRVVLGDEVPLLRAA